MSDSNPREEGIAFGSSRSADSKLRFMATAKTIKIVPVLVTSTMVPMQFVQHLPIAPGQIVPFSKLREWMRQPPIFTAQTAHCARFLLTV